MQNQCASLVRPKQVSARQGRGGFCVVQTECFSLGRFLTKLAQILSPRLGQRMRKAGLEGMAYRCKLAIHVFDKEGAQLGEDLVACWS